MKKKAWRFNKLGCVAFVSGFVLMAYELAGARILAPGIGSSMYIWTSVIGIIIAALSLGYWVGGRVADSRGYAIDLARLCLLAGLTITSTIIWQQNIIAWAADAFVDSRIQGVFASLILFAPTSFVLGTISPYLAKLKVRSLDSTGRSIASLSALNALGSIFGTFVTGFILFGYIGSKETLAMTALVMVGVSWLFVPKVQWRLRFGLSFAVWLLSGYALPAANLHAIDTPTAHYQVFDSGNTRYLITGPKGAQSSVILNKPDRLDFWYARKLAAIAEAAPKKDTILLLGGGAYILPRYLADKYPDSEIDVVEIDPELVEIAREYFFYNDPPNVNLYFQDARAYVNQTKKQYDLVIVDVYGEIQVPFSFMSKEYGDQIGRITAPGGVVAVNMISGLDGVCKETFRAMDAPYRRHFEHARFVADHSDPKAVLINIVATYSHKPFEWEGASPLVLEGRPLYQDNFVPAERLQHDCLHSDKSK